MKPTHIQLISLLIDYLTVNRTKTADLNNFLIDNGILYPEKAMYELTTAVQERLAFHE